MESKIKYIPLGLFCLAMSKILFVGASYVDAPVLLILAGLAAIYETRSQLKVIKSLEDEIQKLKDKNSELDKSISEVKTYLGGIKLGQNIRTTSLGGR